MMVERLLGPYGNIPILIRDDDTNFFTKPSMLQSVYSRAWDKGFKTSFSVIPFQEAMNDDCVPPEARKKENSFYSISRNEGLCVFLKDYIRKGLAEILQHGLSHSVIDDRGEFGADGSDLKRNQRQWLRFGRNILKRALGVEPVFFVPPYDDISNSVMELLSEFGMIPIFGSSIIRGFLNSPFVSKTIRSLTAASLSRIFGKAGFIIPFNIVIRKDCMIVSMQNFDVLESDYDYINLLSETIKSSISNREPVCILNHYHHYFYDWETNITRGDLFKIWQQTLDILSNLEIAWKTSFLELYERARKIEGINIVKTGSKISIQSSEPVEHFAFRTKGGLEPNPYAVMDHDTNIVTIEELSPLSTIILYEK